MTGVYLDDTKSKCAHILNIGGDSLKEAAAKKKCSERGQLCTGYTCSETTDAGCELCSGLSVEKAAIHCKPCFARKPADILEWNAIVNTTLKLEHDFKEMLSKDEDNLEQESNDVKEEIGGAQSTDQAQQEETALQRQELDEAQASVKKMNLSIAAMGKYFEEVKAKLASDVSRKEGDESRIVSSIELV